MRNSSDVHQQQQQQHKILQQNGRATSNGFFPSSFRAISGYLRIVSSGASTVAKSAASVAQSIVDREDDAGHDQVYWAGFDKLECESGVIRRVLLLGYRSGFQVWDVEEAHNVRDLVSRLDGPVSFMQMLPKPITSKIRSDKFADSRPLLIVCSDGSLSGGSSSQDGLATPHGRVSNHRDANNSSFLPTVVRFYSLKSQTYVHMIKFRSIIYSVRCSSRIVAISQAAQIHCFDAATLEREYTILTNPIVVGSPGFGGVGYGPLAVGPRWVAYSGSPVAASNSGRVSPQHLTPSASFPSNGSLVAHYAKESSKQLAAGIVTLGDMGYKKLSRYCSELLPDSHGSVQSGSPGLKVNGTVNGHFADADNIGMVVVRDIVSKLVIAQFRAHKSPISALCFDPSGTLLVTASVQGHNINVFKILPGLSGSSSAGDTGTSYTHLYRLQRGFTNAVIQDISFSDDSNWIMISSSRGTSHLFAINPCGGSVNFQSSDVSHTIKNDAPSKPSWPPTLGSQMQSQQNFCASGPPITLSVVSRIRNGSNGWRSTVTGAAAAATGRLSSFSGAIASSFHNFGVNNDSYRDGTSSKNKYHLLVFSPSGSMIQYALSILAGEDTAAVSGLSTTYEAAVESDGRVVVEAIQKWNVCQKQNRRDREDNLDIYGENGNSDSNKIYPEGIRRGKSIHPESDCSDAKSQISLEEKHHLYISEAELQMHEACMPLWAKSEVYFQTMMAEGIDLNEENQMQGEVEIEKIPTRTIEARSKDLIPVFDYLQIPKFLHARLPSLDGNINGRLQHQRSGFSENGRLSRKSSSASLDSVTQSGALVVDLPNGLEDTQRNGPRMLIETRESVNISGSPKTYSQLEVVNNRESLVAEAQVKFVNNNNAGLKMENHFEHEGEEFD
ncbi:hypothetical protein Tsubulata_017108 [Turnera subulata]|uniref:BCAS3 domain-containing protein n=1 Tax=Turnera subulata TaxID=218843 RepID=A0A9Q0FKU5_9ROSI|nr:hypothetical protein Tsubulata_017108 [Turnera subulata]